MACHHIVKRRRADLLLVANEPACSLLMAGADHLGIVSVQKVLAGSRRCSYVVVPTDEGREAA